MRCNATYWDTVGCTDIMWALLECNEPHPVRWFVLERCRTWWAASHWNRFETHWQHGIDPVTAKARVLNPPSVCRLDTLAAGRVEVTCPLTSFQLFLTYILTKCYAVGGSSVASLGRYMTNMKVSVLPFRLQGRQQCFDWLTLQSNMVTIRTVCLSVKKFRIFAQTVSPPP